MTGVGEPRDLDLEAAEYVLGTLDLGERSAFEQRLRGEGGAKRAVSEWERRFAGLAGRLDPVTPPTSVWETIERTLARPTEAVPQTFRVIDGGGLLADGAPRLQASRNRWRVAALALGSIAAALAALVVADLRVAVTPAPSQRYIAAVNRGGDKPALLVSVDLETRRILVMPVAAEAPAGRSLELWYIGDDKTPKPMGLVDTSPATMAIPAGATPTDATFAVSVEPPGGSTTGGPTGPVVYSGKLVRE